MSVIDNKAVYLDESVNNILRAYQNKMDDFSMKLRECSYKLEALNPVNVLLRGYSVAKTEKGVVKKKADLEKGQDFLLTVSDGDIECIVK